MQHATSHAEEVRGHGGDVGARQGRAVPPRPGRALRATRARAEAEGAQQDAATVGEATGAATVSGAAAD